MFAEMDGYLACFSLGSNMGDREMSLERSAGLLSERAGSLECLSGMYESPPWGYESDSAYINCCLVIRTAFDPLELMDIALEIERQMGRTREGSGYSDRVIDVDLLLCGELVVDHPRLIIPHPRMSLRRFVLVPLAEIMPDLRHPVSGHSISELLESCPDQSLLTPV
jgi:2-amino-4-hydroxy-6-hydroxymethyldihydropteridine diphosphokinase